MSEVTTLQTWELYYPEAGATGTEIARARIDPTEVVWLHAAPPVLAVTVREGDDRVLAPRPSFGKTELLALVSGKVSYRTPGGKVTKLSDAVIVPNGTEFYRRARARLRLVGARRQAASAAHADAP